MNAKLENTESLIGTMGTQLEVISHSRISFLLTKVYDTVTDNIDDGALCICRMWNQK